MRGLLVVVGISSCCPPMQEATTPTAPPKVTVMPAVAPAPVTPPVPVGPPVARTVEAVDTEHGLRLADPYRWMEGLDNKEHEQWLLAHGQHAAKQLAAIPGRDKLHARIREVGLGVSALWDVQRGGKRLFYRELPANAQLAKLAVREPDGTTRVLVDPEKLDGESHASLNAYSASPDGTHVAYVIARGGGERGEMRVMNVATGKDLPSTFERIWGENAASWMPDGKRFFYSQLAVPAPGVDPMTNQITRMHVLGTDAAMQDVTILGRDATATWKMAPEEWPGIWVAHGSKYAIAFAGGARPDVRVGIAKVSELDTTGASKTPWRAVAEYSDSIGGVIPHGDRLYLLSAKGAPNRRILSVPLAAPDLSKARVEVAEDPGATLVSMLGARDALYLLHMVDGLARVSRWPWRGKPTPIALPYEGWAPGFAAELAMDGIVFEIESWLRIGTYFAYDAATKKVMPTGLASSSTADVSDLITEEVEVTSADGTKVPLSIVRRKDMPRDGSAPAIVHGYAAYGVSQTSSFSASRIVWVERGGVFAICHGRGGGEKGRAWQDAGSRANKLAGIRDFIACGQYLVDNKYSSPSRMGASGGSMGGVLAGRAITERPDLFAAAHLSVPIVNPLRILHAENGANQKGELGDPETEAGYRALAEMDPYLHVKDGTAYPAVIFTVGKNDHRVAPWMASKMAARLLAASTSKRPVLLRVDEQAGHGIGSTRDQAFAERADVWSFFLATFGDREFVSR